jgi:N-acetylneuraminic acid mutarotase
MHGMKVARTCLLSFALLSLTFLSCSGGDSSSGGTAQSASPLTPDGPPITWATKRPMPTPRTELGVATVNNRLYAIGGYSGTALPGSVLQTVEEYDPAADTWTRKADMPTPRRQLVVVAVNGRIYAIGGASFTSNTSSVIYSYATEEYDPATDTWTAKASMPTDGGVNSILGNRFIGGAAANGKIYIAVYNNPGTPWLTHAHEYDPATNTWTSKTAPPFNYTRYAVASHGNKVYALSDIGEFAEYDPAKDAWTIQPPTTTSRFRTGFTSSGGKLYSVGGGTGSSATSAVEEFDPVTHNWAVRASLPSARTSVSAGEVSGRLYAVGGSSNTSESNPIPLTTLEEGSLPPSGSVLQIPTGDAVTAISGQVTVRWNPVAGATSYNLYMASNPNLDRSNYSGLADGAKLVGVTSPHTISGLTNGRTYYFFVTAANATWESEESFGSSATPAAAPALQWSTKASMPTPRLDAGAATVNGRIYVIGGFSGSTLAATEEYDPATDTWTPKANMPTPRRAPVVASVNNRIYAIGGMSYPNRIDQVLYTYVTEEYDPAANTWTAKAPMPIGNAVNSVLGNRFIAGAAVNGRIYITVFNNSGLPPMFSTFEYDPAADAWDIGKAPVPFGHSQYTVTSLNGILYALNGDTSGASSFAEYSPATDTWTVKASPLRNLSQARLIAVPVKNKLYAVGGSGSSDVYDAVQEYDPATNTWTIQASVPIPRHSAATAELGGNVYAFGGSLFPERIVIGSTFLSPFPLADVEEGR